jgi:uncharacterized protein YlxP (DUF503 family)
MALINLSVKHGKSLEEARALLQSAVNEIQARFGPLVQRTDWAPDRSSVKMVGVGFEAELRVDAQEVHLSGDLPFLGNLLGGGLKGILERTFHKQLPA